MAVIRLDRIERSLETLTRIVSENRADIAAAGARMDALIQTIAESTIRSAARMDQMQERLDRLD